MKPAGVGFGSAAAVLVLLTAGEALRLARDPPPEGGPVAASTPQEEIPPYDGRFTFLRIQFGADGSDLRSFGRFRRGRGRQAPWEHDRPRAEQHFAKILEATTFIDARQEEEAGIYLPLDDPRLFEYPIAYICEVGYWRPTDDQAEALRNYLLKGGFLIVDDFRGRDLNNFEDQMDRVLPGVRFFRLSGADEVFDSFFRIPEP
ncbi:MAG TPA: DUF4159 domain-containing protein, partial [Longimicrobiales bacterium]|nr:DUF4159 domain-containing protein [Longimicrobiales bacterium]